MKKLMLVVPVCLLAASGLYAQPTSPARVGKGARAAKQAAKTAAGVPAIENAVKEAVETTSKIITQPSGLVSAFHNLGGMKNWKEPTPDSRWSYYTRGHWSLYALKDPNMKLLSAPPVRSTVPASKKPTSESLKKELIDLGMRPELVEVMSYQDRQDVLDAYYLFLSVDNTAPRFEPSGYAAQRTFDQLKWASRQIDFFQNYYIVDDYYKGRNYTRSFNPKAGSMRVLMVTSDPIEKYGFEMVQKQAYPNVTIEFASTVEEAETMLYTNYLNNEYDIVLSGLDLDIEKGGFSVAMFAHNSGLITPVIIASSRLMSPYALYCYNVVGQIYAPSTLDERAEIINYLSNVVVNRREKLGF